MHKMELSKLSVGAKLGRIDPALAYGKLKYKCNDKEIEQVFNDLLNTKNKASAHFYKGAFPTSYKELYTGELTVYSPDCVKEELIWNAMIIKRHGSKINEFLKHKKEFEVFFLNGKYEAAEEILTTVEKSICYSSWTLENRFLLAEFQFGLEKNKDFLNIINQIENNDPLTWFSDIFSYKVEKAITETQYKNRMGKLLNRVEDEVLHSYFKYKISGIANFSSKDFGDILFFEGISSITDRYMTFIKTCQFICAGDMTTEIKQVVKKCLMLIGEQIKDPQLDIMRAYFTKTIQNVMQVFDLEMNEIGHLYTIGEYKYVIQRCSELFDQHANCFELYEFYIKSLLYEGRLYNSQRECIRDQLIIDMFNAYAKKQGTFEAYHNLLKYIRILNNTCLSASLFGFVYDRYGIEKQLASSVYSALNSMFINPRICIAYEKNEDKLLYLNNFKSVAGEKAHISLFETFYNANASVHSLESIPTSRRAWYDIKKRIYFNTNIEKVKIELQGLCNEKYESNIEIYKYEKILVELFRLLLRLQEYEQCMDLFVSYYLDNKYLTLRMDFEKLNKRIWDNLTKSIKENISLPILTHICLRGHTAKLYTAYANFLDAIGLERPTKILLSSYEKKKMIYFLRYICVSEVMDSAYAIFDSEEKVDNERVEICQFLRKIDPENDGLYVSEISQITQSYSLMKRMQLLDESKIDIDLKSIKMCQRELLIQNYNRFKEIGNFDISYDILDTNSSRVYVINYYDKKDNNAVVEKKNQQLVLFKEMLIDYRDEFSFGQHGVDASLSTRIRHGRLQNQIRSVFQQYGLVNLKASDKSSMYIPHESLQEALLTNGFTAEFANDVHSHFAQFSKKIDDKIDELNSTWIRIKTESLNPEGMINMSFSEKQIWLLYSAFGKLNSVDLILDYFEAVLLDSVETSLCALRKRINEELKAEFVNYIIELEEGLDGLFNPHKECFVYQNLKQNMIHCRTAVQNEISTIAEWFKPPKRQEFNDYSFKQLLETCEVINRKLYASYHEIKIDINDNSSSFIKGYTFSYFTEIFVILFNNAISHSGYINELKRLKIVLYIDETETGFVIKIVNNLALNVEHKEVLDKILLLKERIKESEEKGITNYEGGSGYIKINRMIKYNIGVAWTLYICLDDDNNFVAEFYLDKKLIIQEKQNEACDLK